MTAINELTRDITSDADPASMAEVPITPNARARNFAEMKMSQKMRWVFGAQISLLIVLAILCFAALTVDGKMVLNHVGRLDVNNGAMRVKSNVQDARIQASQYALTGNASDIDSSLASLAEAREGLGQITARAAELELDLTDATAPLLSSIAGFETDVTQLRSETGAGRRQSLDAISADGRRMEEVASDLVQVTEVGPLRGDLSVGAVLLGLAGMVLLLAIWQNLYNLRLISRMLVVDLRTLIYAMRDLSRGRKNIEIPGAERVDEIGEMSRALTVFRDKSFELEALQAEQAEAAKAQLRQEEEHREKREAFLAAAADKMRAVADRFESTVGDVAGGVASASTQLHSTATMMAKAAEVSSDQAGDVTKAMEEASAGVTAAAAASDEFAMSIGEISRQAASSAELARKASQTAHEADTTISALSDSADQVGQIVELIQTIAQRTNLLALNASIEAARGGEAGRGFAVVASEVKELAAQTSKATQDVAEQIREMQDTTGASVGALRAISDQIDQLESTAVSIAAAVDQQSVAGQDLARSIDVAARGTDEVNNSISKVRETALSTGAAATQVLSSANELEEQAATLRGQVSEFLNHVRAS